MTDAELIELVQTKIPPELTAAEVKKLRDRMIDSLALRQALAEHLEMERYLTDILGQVCISPEQILARAVQGTPAAQLGNWWRPWAALMLVLSIALVVGGLVWRSRSSGGGGMGPVDATDRVAALPSNPTPAKPPEAGAAPLPARPPETVPRPSLPDEPKAIAVEPPRDVAPEPFALVDLSEAGWDETHVKAWFDPVEGQPQSLRPVPAANSQGASTEMTGLWRLRPEWKPGAALRCLFRTMNAFKFHVWNGDEGVTLELWPRNQELPDSTLAAYRTTRMGKGPRPETMVLAATDEGEFSRTRTQSHLYGSRLVSVPIDLRHQDGLLIVSCGDVRILSVSFPAAPAEIYFEGKASFQSLGIVPLVALPPLRAPLPTVLDVDQLVEREWLGDRANLEKLPDSSVELHTEKTDRPFAAATLLPPRKICEVVVQLEEVTPGTGVFLGDEKGQPRYLASFLRDEVTGRTLVLPTSPTATADSVRFEASKRWPPAFVAGKVWLRLLRGCDQLNCWVSGDGVHWARAFQPPLGGPTWNWASVGLICQPGEPRRSIRLRRLMLRELSTLSSLAPEDLIHRAPLVPQDPLHPLLLSEWLRDTQAFRPPEVDPAVWARACAIRALSSGVIPGPSNLEVLENLLDYGLKQSIPFEDKVRLVDEALMLAPWSRDAFAAEQRLVKYYERLGQSLQREGEPRPYSRLRQALYHNPLWASSYAIDVFPKALATAEMLDLAGAGKWEEVANLARIGRIHRVSPSVFDWAEALAAGRPRLTGRARAQPALLSGGQPALVLEPDKDSTTDLREMEAACEANLLRETGRMVTGLKGRGDRSLLIDSKDSQWLMSWPVALSGLHKAHPGLRTMLRTEFAPEGRLGLRQALDEKDEPALESLTVRYYGTEEAAEALLWLGDRYLLDGEAALALARFREALSMAEEEKLRRRIDDRLELTAALLGRSVATPAARDIEFGATRLSPAALEALRKKRREAGGDSRVRASLPPQFAPLPTAFDVVPHGRFDGERGDKPDALPLLPPSLPRLNLDWFARQVALTVDSDRLFVSNRFQVDCYELPSGKLQWRTALSREPSRQEQPAPAYDYALTPMRPVVAGPNLFVRRLMLGPPVRFTKPYGVATLACLETATGKVEWSTTNHLTGRLHYVSDPLVIQDQVFALAEKQPLDGDQSLALLIHNRADGRLLAERPLISVRSSFDRQRSCQLTALEDGCVATVGGSVLCFDLSGTIRWARRPLWIPAEADPHWLSQPHDPPLVVGGRCFVVQPGVLNLVCLAPESGRLHWQKAIAGLRRLTGLVGDRLLLQTDSGFLCLEAATGKEQWRHDAPPLLAGALCGGRGGLMYSTSEAIPGAKGLTGYPETGVFPKL